ncbi:DNA-directed DNA polymerase II small subunit [Haloplanus salilacus]|uniref:DNA-directed DNA polymerase II small subunit n=1 Tax=Haloplanus salilacus TaxID=2949994 RepID=UPI0030D4CE02
MPLETPVRVARELARRGYNAEREAVTLLANASDPAAALDAAVETADDDALRLTAAHVRSTLDATTDADTDAGSPDEPATTTPTDPAASTTDGSAIATTDDPSTTTDEPNSSVSTAGHDPTHTDSDATSPVETEGCETATRTTTEPTPDPSEDPGSPPPVTVTGDITGRSTGTGEYADFVSVFRDRYETLSAKLRGRVNHRPASAIEDMTGGNDVAMIGLVDDVRSSANGHWIVELEDTTGTVSCMITKGRDLAGVVDEILLDECLAVEGTLSDDAGLVFVDTLHFPDVPRTHRPNTADRHVQAALVSDVHVGSQEFMADAWNRFADWLHTEEAEAVEYLLLAGDMVEGVGVYPDQDEELDIVDIYDQYERFSEHLKAVPGDLEIVMIPGNHDAVRLAEPQPAFDQELRDMMSAHDARVVGNPSTVTVEGVSVLMYHGVSLDEVIAELPEEKASYDEPHRAMYQLLKKRHVAPTYGGRNRLAPEEEDYLVVDEVPDVFHTGHVHKLGYGKYHDVLAVNSGCWQAQTAFQKSVNIDPDAGFAPIVDLDTLDLTVRKFA